MMKRWIKSLKGWLKRKRRLLTLAICLLAVMYQPFSYAEAYTVDQVAKRQQPYNITLITHYACGDHKDQFSFETITETTRWLEVYGEQWDIVSHVEGNYTLQKRAAVDNYPCENNSLISLLPDSLLSLFGDTFGPKHIIQSYFHFDTLRLESNLRHNQHRLDKNV